MGRRGTVLGNKDAFCRCMPTRAFAKARRLDILRFMQRECNATRRTGIGFNAMHRARKNGVVRQRCVLVGAENSCVHKGEDQAFCDLCNAARGAGLGFNASHEAQNEDSPSVRSCKKAEGIYLHSACAGKPQTPDEVAIARSRELLRRERTRCSKSQRNATVRPLRPYLRECRRRRHFENLKSENDRNVDGTPRQ